MAAMPGIVAAAVLQKSDDSELKDTAACEGPDFDKDRSLDGLCAKLLTTGFQATNIGLAVKEIERMRAWRLSDVPITENEDDDYKMDVLEDLEDVSSPSPRARLALPVSLHTDAARRCSTRR